MLIDIHVHLRAPDTALERCGFPLPGELLACLEADGIDRAVVMGIAGPELVGAVIAPEELLAICASSRDAAGRPRLIPFLGIDPREHDPAVIPGHIRRWQAAGCRGIGELVHNIPFDDPRNDPVFATAAELGLPVTAHIAPELGRGYGLWDELGLPRLQRVLERFPELIVLGHSQVFWAHVDAGVSAADLGGYPHGPVRPGRVVDLMRRFPNLWGDLSAGSGYNALARDPDFGLAFLAEFRDRLCFGTDRYSATMTAPLVAWWAEQQRGGTLAPDLAAQIGHRNASRLLGLAA